MKPYVTRLEIVRMTTKRSPRVHGPPVMDQVGGHFLRW